MPPLRVMKFGGTSVGDAACIARAADIVKSAASAGSVVVVVSAMSGVTNRLIDAAHHAEAGEAEFATRLIAELRTQHTKALKALLRDTQRAAEVEKSLSAVLAELERLLQGTAFLKELTPRALDAISGMGERLSAPLLAAALNELGISSVAVAATEVIVTDPVADAQFWAEALNLGAYDLLAQPFYEPEVRRILSNACTRVVRQPRSMTAV